MKSAKKRRTFAVGLGIRIWTEIEVEASTYEEALEKARKLELKDIVDFDTPFNDGGMDIISLYDSSKLDRITD